MASLHMQGFGTRVDGRECLDSFPFSIHTFAAVAVSSLNKVWFNEWRETTDKRVQLLWKLMRSTRVEGNSHKSAPSYIFFPYRHFTIDCSTDDYNDYGLPLDLTRKVKQRLRFSVSVDECKQGWNCVSYNLRSPRIGRPWDKELGSRPL